MKSNEIYYYEEKPEMYIMKEMAHGEMAERRIKPEM